jgi:hypothetical protein
VRFFLDNCLPPRLANALAALSGPDGHTVVHLRDKFPPDTEDTAWIRSLADDGDWIIVSGDPRITRNPAEREAWRESQLTAFFLKSGWTNLEFWIQVSKLIALWPKIVAHAEYAERGSGFFVPVRGLELEEIN